MKLCRLTAYGIFDMAQTFPGMKRTNDRRVTHYEIEYYISATGKSIINGREYEIAPGNLLCGKPGQIRASIFGFRCYYLHLALSEDSPYRALLDASPDYYQIVDREVYGRLFESLIAHLLSEGYDEESDFVNARLLELFYYLKRDSANNRSCPTSFDKNRNRFIPKTVDFIRENYHKRLTLEDLARVAGYSPNYFHHVFTAVMGVTPQQYLLAERIRRAKILLAESEKPISEIAYECGFASQSHFSLRFRELTYCTPGEYRRRSNAHYRV